jgi:hypothetical protein
MVSKGCCPHRLASFGNFVFSDTLYTLSLLGTRDLLNGHEQCSTDACVGTMSLMRYTTKRRAMYSRGVNVIL